MVTRFFKFLIVLVAIFLSATTHAQVMSAHAAAFPHVDRVVEMKSAPSISTQRMLVLSSFSSPVPADQYVRTLPFFCRQEVRIEKVVSIPVKFRIGSLEQCNKLEGK